ncbi:ent-kaurenoic acid oxidase 1-like [Vicia villosa]|uniref:ent-kaurenoic acid oxidase 1-like n=1 Tax=Vicia villosa TaxID=3911 RepID=UPI00273AAAC3|nr:ent-kaurenoic acid oxidase 1-like [Vicia villosa]
MDAIYLGLFGVFIGFVLWWWNEYWYIIPLKFKCFKSSTKLPPGHMGLPFIGEMITFLWYFKIVKRPDDFINAKRRKYGDEVGMFRTHLFGAPSIIVYTPNIHKFVLHKEDKLIAEWPTIELMGRTSLLTFENIGKLFMGKEPSPLLNSLDKLYQDLLLGVRAFPINIPGFAYHHALQCRKKLEDVFYMELDKRKNENKIEIIDLMDGLMKIEDEEGDKLSDKEVIDNIVSLVAAGYISTSLISTWAIYLLAKYPIVLKKLREENMAFTKGSPQDFITPKDVSNLKYTNKVVEEVIRMANVAACVFRKVDTEVNYKGYKIPKGWTVILLLRYLHTDPENFKNPMYFNPDRWDEPLMSGTYQPFGGGPRLCPGNTLARIQLAILLHHLSIGYRWELVNPNADIIYLSHPAPMDGVEIQGFKKCSNFVWLDEEMNPRSKEVISSLLKNLNDEKQRSKDSIAKEEEMRMKMKMLKKQLKFNWSITIIMFVTLVAAIIMK